MLRPATLADIPIIQQLAELCYLPAYVGIHSEEQNRYMMQQMYSTESLEHQIIDQHAVFLLLYVDEQPAGYCAYKPHAVEPRTLMLDKLYLLPSLKGRGLGRLLVEEVFSAAHRLYPQGYTILLDVNRHNAARSFYEHLGFSVVRSYDAPIGNGYYMNAYEMRLVREFSRG